MGVRERRGGFDSIGGSGAGLRLFDDRLGFEGAADSVCAVGLARYAGGGAGRGLHPGWLSRTRGHARLARSFLLATRSEEAGAARYLAADPCDPNIGDEPSWRLHCASK